MSLKRDLTSFTTEYMILTSVLFKIQDTILLWNGTSFSISSLLKKLSPHTLSFKKRTMFFNLFLIKKHMAIRGASYCDHWCLVMSSL